MHAAKRLPLNAPPVLEPQVAVRSLLPPLSVLLTHVAVQRSSSTLTLAVMCRYRTKHVTVVLYKPRPLSDAEAMETDAAAGFRMPAARRD